MKKIYILGIIGLGAIAASAQKATQETMHIKRIADKEVISVVQQKSVKVNTKNFYGFGKTEGVSDIAVGTTRWVLQTGGAPYRRVHVTNDGKISVTWTASVGPTATNSTLTRGSGYNHFNGTAWGEVSGRRIEQQRTGFPNIALSPTNKEIILAHRVDTNGASGGLMFNQNESIGSTTWTSNVVFTPITPTSPTQLWPRIAVAGDYMIVIANYQDSTDDQPSFITRNGMRSPLVYSRYQFSTSTWVTQDAVLPGYDSSLSLTRRGAAESYSIDANGNTVAIVLSDPLSSTVLWKSTDAGATWTKTVIDEIPTNVVLYRDTFGRTGTDGSCNVLVDANGKVHYFSGKATVADSTDFTDQNYSYFLSRVVGSENASNDGILYWNDTEKVLRQIAFTPANAAGDAILGGSFTSADRRYDISNATWPSASIGPDGTIYTIFSALTPGDFTGEDDASDANFRDIYAFYSKDNGATWSIPINLTSFIDLGGRREEVYPNLAKRVDEKLHLSYLLKKSPGTTAADEDYSINYYSIPTARIVSGAIGLNETANTLFAISSNYPNPFNGSTIIPVELTQKTNVTIRVYDILGAQVFTKTYDNTFNGVNELEVSGNFKSGFYIYTVEAGGYTVSGKMLAE